MMAIVFFFACLDSLVWGRAIRYCRQGVVSGQVCCPRRCEGDCATRQCGNDPCCADRRRQTCRSVGATDCLVPPPATQDRELLYKAGCRDCVAVLLTGHVRTYRRTAAALARRLLNAGHQYDLVVATYSTQDASTPRWRDKTKHSTDADTVVTASDVFAAYDFSQWRAAWLHVYDEAEIGAILPRDLRRQAGPHLGGVKEEHLAQINRVKRSLALVQQGSWMVEDLAAKRGAPHVLVVRLRPDIQLLAPFPLDEARGLVAQKRNLVVVPTTYDPRGGLNIKAAQLTTRPCARNASLTPTWVQDHLAVGSAAAMRLYANFYHAYLKKDFFSGHVEKSLAKYLASHALAVSCFDNIKYTVLR